jgi:hypothetical protein
MQHSAFIKFKSSLLRLFAAGIFFVLSFILNRFGAAFPEALLSSWRQATLTFFDFFSRALSALPFSVAEIALYGIAAGTLIGLVTAILASIAFKEAGSLLSYFSNLALTAALLLFFYYALFGMWTSAPSPIMPPLERVEPTAELVHEAALDMQQRANELSKRVARRPDSTVNFGSFESMAERVAAAFEPRVEPLGFERVAPPKRPVWSKALSYGGISGIFVPFTAESHANADMPAVYIPFTMAHELAHRYGTPAEDYCNYIAYDLLIDAEPDLAYSAAFSGYNYLSNALYMSDPALWMEFKKGESEQLTADIAQTAAYWRAFEGPVQTATLKINDLHIKMDGDPDGQKSYLRIVDLLVSRYVGQKDALMDE